MTKRRSLLATPAVMVSLPAGAQALAESESSRGPLRYIVPAPPGGLMDVMARLVGQRLSERTGRLVVIDNRPGGNAMIGPDIVAKSPPDGQTVGAISLAHAVYVSLFPNAPYDLRRDLAAVSILGSIPLVIVVPAASPARDMTGLISLVRERPTNAGSPTSGSPSHLAVELLRSASGAGDRIVHVPYRGGPQVITDLMTGTLDLSAGNLLDVAGPVRAGRLRALAQTGSARHPLLADVPTVEEVGLPSLQIANWTAMLAPSATPARIRARLAEEVVAALRDPEITRRAEEAGFQVLSWEPERSDTFLRAEIERWGAVVAAAHIKPD